MRLRRVFLATSVVALFLSALVWAAKEEPVAELQARFDAETDAEHKAKLLGKLCRAQIEDERAATKAGDFEKAGLIMEKYRDNIRASFDALKRFHPNAKKHSGGYQRIEFQNQNGLREVEDLQLAMPAVYKPPMEIVRRDLSAMEDQLLLLLFPDRPAGKPLPPKEKQPSTAPPEKGTNP
ncbi:MAG TPA: hypothetical protein VLV88_08905 [Terriglobales bacterium]|nr:hypothetical protein [Terriglobales bacterium]